MVQMIVLGLFMTFLIGIAAFQTARLELLRSDMEGRESWMNQLKFDRDKWSEKYVHANAELEVIRNKIRNFAEDECGYEED